MHFRSRLRWEWRITRWEWGFILTVLRVFVITPPFPTHQKLSCLGVTIAALSAKPFVGPKGNHLPDTEIYYLMHRNSSTFK